MLSNALKKKVIDGWLDANNAVLYNDESGKMYIVDTIDEDIHCNSFEELYELALLNTKESVESLRAQGESDEDIKGYGFILPETIKSWEVDTKINIVLGFVDHSAHEIKVTDRGYQIIFNDASTKYYPTFNELFADALDDTKELVQELKREGLTDEKILKEFRIDTSVL